MQNWIERESQGSPSIGRSSLRRRLGAWAVAGSTALFVACGGGDATPPPPSIGQATIDAAGGEVQGPDGVRLVIPAGALSAATTFRIARDGTGAPEIGGAKPISPVYSVTPHGMPFGASARLSIPFDAAQVTPGTRPVLLRGQPGGNWEVLTTDVQGSSVSAADTPGLSFFAVGACYTTRDIGINGPDPLFYCPSAHELRLVLLNSDGTQQPAPRNGSGVAQPVQTITDTPTALRYSLTWTRPAGTQRSDRLRMQINNAGLLPSQQPLPDFPVSRDFTTTFTTTIDPATVPGAGAAGGTVIRLVASAEYTTDAYYPGCLCFRPATWTFSTDIAVRVVYTGTLPTITQHPQNRSVSVGQTATFDVVANGPELSYQWWNVVGQAPPTDLPGATGTTYTTPGLNFAAHNGHFYGVHVCSRRGTPLERCAHSNAALLTVTQQLAVPTFTISPASISVIEGQTASFNAVASGAPTPTVEWGRVTSFSPFVSTSPICTASTGSGTSTSASCTIGPLTVANDGMRVVAIASNTAGQTLSGMAQITVSPRAIAPTITTPAEPADRTVVEGSSVSWTVGASGTPSPNYWWRTVNPAGMPQTNVVCEPTPVGPRNVTTTTLTFNPVPMSCSGWRVQLMVSNGTQPDAISRAALLTVTPASAAPQITTPLQNRSVLHGTQVTFNVGASGTPSSFTYTWTLDGLAVPNIASGCTSSSSACTFTAYLADSGRTLRVIVANGQLPDATSSALLTVTSNDVAATITQQPLDAAGVTGGSVAFAVGVAGTPSPSVDWQRNDGSGWVSTGVTSRTLTLDNLLLSMNGLRLRALVRNTIAAGTGTTPVTVTSSEATLTVTAASVPGMVLFAGDFTGARGGGSGNGVGTGARFDTPIGLLADNSGNLFVANGNGLAGIQRIETVTANVTLVALLPPGASAGLASLALASDGSLYASTVSYCDLYRVTAPASATPTLATQTLNGCTGSTARGLAFDSMGTLHLSQFDGNAVLRVASVVGNTGPFQGVVFVGAADVYVPPGSADGTGGNARFNGPYGAAFAANGDLFIADSGNHTIRRVTPMGVVSTFAGSAGLRATLDGDGPSARFNNPTDLSFDSLGNLLVLERGDPASNPVAYVRRITPAGSVTTLFNATAESLALAAPGQEAFARNIRGMTLLGNNRIALAAGNAILVRTLP